MHQKSFKDFDVVVVVVLHSSQLPEQKEGLFMLGKLSSLDPVS